MAAVEATKDRRNSPTNVARRAAAHVLLDKAFDAAASADDHECCLVTLNLEFHRGTAQVQRVYTYGRRLG